ncbi:MAG: hypothetical protein ACHQUA_00025 [Microgenomates group bacterium]
MTEPKSRITGLDLLKIMGLGLAATAVNAARKPIGKVVEAIGEGSVDVFTEESIHKYLGLTKDQVELTWAVRNHVLDQEFYDKHIGLEEKERFIDTEKRRGPLNHPKTIILGEIAPEVIDNIMINPMIFSLPTIPRLLFYPSMGSDDRELLENQRITNKLLLEGYDFVTTDSYPGELFNDKTIKPDYLNQNLVSLLSGLSALVKGIRVLKSGKADIHDVKDVSILTGISFATSIWSEVENSISQAAGNQGDENSNYGQHYNQLKRVLEKISLKKPLFTRLTEGIIDFRNIVMTLNTWHTLAQTDISKGKVNFIFYAGGGHGAVDEEFRKGPKELESELQPYIDRLLTDTLTVLTNGVNQSKIVKAEAAKSLGEYFCMFSQSQTVSKNYNFDVSERDVRDTHSSLYLLWENVEKKLKDLEQEEPRETNLQYQILKEAQFHLLKKLELTSQVLWHAKNKVKKAEKIEYRETILDRKDIEETITWFEPRDYFLASQESFLISNTNRLIVGVAKINGSIYPVARRFDVSPDAENVFWIDQVQLPGGFISKNGSQHLMVGSSPSKSVGNLGNNLGFGVVLEVKSEEDSSVVASNVEGISITKIDDHELQTHDKFYPNTDQGDPLKMGYIIVKRKHKINNIHAK